MKVAPSANKFFRRSLRLPASLSMVITLFLISAQIWADDGEHGRKDRGHHRIKNVVVIYQENWSFDSLYGLFPGANGISQSSLESLTQRDRLTGQPYPAQSGEPFDLVSGSLTLTTPPQPINNGQIDASFPANFDTLVPYDLVGDAGLQVSDKTGDIVHRFWHEQSQINRGKMNWFVTWSDNPGLVMSYFDATNLPEGLLAQQYTLCDNFFHAAFGGSFLNHQFLIAAQAPVYPNAAASMQATVDATGQLALDPTSGQIVHDGNITPIGSQSFSIPSRTFDKNYAVNTIFSANLAAANSDPHSTGLLPSQNDSDPSDTTRPYIPTIGDRLSAENVSWKWYSGGWDNALASSPTNPANNGTTPPNPPVDPLFQWHHQPFAYYDNYAPWKDGQPNPESAAHLQDENNFFGDLQNNTLPAVSFIKPLGPNNEHPGYTDLLTGQQHVADLVNAVKQSDYWDQTLIIVTYDEHGGRWDHVPPPTRNGVWGDGSRVPAIVIGPFAKQGYIDHKEHDTLSILKTIERLFDVDPLNQYDAKASSLASSLSIPED
ncbi:MAG TPA: acid phosphatase [Acidobacteriaceae bacterium]